MMICGDRFFGWGGGVIGGGEGFRIGFVKMSVG